MDTSQVEWWRNLLSAVTEPADLVGLSREEIERLEVDQGRRFPGSYRAFLEAGGRRCGRLFRGTRALYPDLLNIREDAATMLAEANNPMHLLPDDVPIMVHQGYILHYLHGPGDDPRVMVWAEEDPDTPREAAESFSALVIGDVEAERQRPPLSPRLQITSLEANRPGPRRGQESARRFDRDAVQLVRSYVGIYRSHFTGRESRNGIPGKGIGVWLHSMLS